MLQKLRNAALAFSGIILVGLAPALMGPSGGFPSRPRFQAVGVGTVAPANSGQQAWSGSVGAAGLVQTTTNTNNGATAFSAWRLVNDAAHTAQIGQTSSTTASSFIYTGGPTTEQMFLGTNENIPITFGVNGTEVLRLTSTDTGTFNSNVQGTGCTTGSVTWAYKKMGAVVALKITARTNFPAACSGGTMIDSSGNIPAAIRPTTTTTLTGGVFTNNAVTQLGCVDITPGGNMNYGVLATGGGSCGGSNWTGAGNRDFAVGTQYSYSIN